MKSFCLEISKYYRAIHLHFCCTGTIEINNTYSILQIFRKLVRILPHRINLQHLAPFLSFYRLPGYQHYFSRPPVNLTYEERMAHEQLDVKMIRLIQEQILPRASHTPSTFISHVMTLLNRGSVHATSPQPLTTGIC